MDGVAYRDPTIAQAVSDKKNYVAMDFHKALKGKWRSISVGGVAPAGLRDIATFKRLGFECLRPIEDAAGRSGDGASSFA